MDQNIAAAILRLADAALGFNRSQSVIDYVNVTNWLKQEMRNGGQEGQGGPQSPQQDGPTPDPEPDDGGPED